MASVRNYDGIIGQNEFRTTSTWYKIGFLLNELIRRSGNKARARHFNSLDWKSLTFTGERHQISMVADNRAPLEAMLADIEDAEFAIPTAILADIAASTDIKPLGNGQFAVDVEALTIDEDAQ